MNNHDAYEVRVRRVNDKFIWTTYFINSTNLAKSEIAWSECDKLAGAFLKAYASVYSHNRDCEFLSQEYNDMMVREYGR